MGTDSGNSNFFHAISARITFDRLIHIMTNRTALGKKEISVSVARRSLGLVSSCFLRAHTWRVITQFSLAFQHEDIRRYATYICM
jgi:hypothetical protein